MNHKKKMILLTICDPALLTIIALTVGLPVIYVVMHSLFHADKQQILFIAGMYMLSCTTGMFLLQHYQRQQTIDTAAGKNVALRHQIEVLKSATLPTASIAEHLGVVTGLGIAYDFTGVEEWQQEWRQVALSDLLEQAAALGANAVVDLRWSQVLLTEPGELDDKYSSCTATALRLYGRSRQ